MFLLILETLRMINSIILRKKHTHCCTKERQRISKWFQQKHNEVISSEYPQVKAFTINRKIDVSRSSNESLKK